ncbi:MAG: 30S ribosome-binding factor RbfA [Flavobacteriaceae bacterium]|nr:30S ribosome-binding factor RbfA [Flavobacteriaceae bacterium]
MEKRRLNKISKLIQKDLGEIIQNDARTGMKGTIISVTEVSVTDDLSIAKVYLSVFPKDRREGVVQGLKDNTPAIRNALAQKIRHQLRKIPRLSFHSDESLDYVEAIEASLKGEDENPIKNPSILDKRGNI